MDKVNKQARLFYKKLKGELTVPNVIKFLNSLGYDTVFFNTDEGDELALLYSIDLENKKALTYFGITRIVFVDDELHADDKLYVLLHECGHILLDHLDENQAHSMGELKCENEAEAFTYAVMHNPQRKWSLSILLCSVLLLSVLFAGLQAVQTQITPDSESVITEQAISKPAKTDTIVYVTRTGSCYHRATCTYAKNHTTSQMYKTEAAKTLSPCSFCKP